MRLISNPFLTIYFDPNHDSLVLIEPLEKRHFTIDDPDWLSIISFAKQTKTKKQLYDYLIKKDFTNTHKSAQYFISSLIKKNILVSNSLNIKKLLDQKKMFDGHGWDEAFFYHLYTRDYPFLDYSKAKDNKKDISLMEEYKNLWPLPPIYKTYKDKPQIDLKINKKQVEKLTYPLILLPPKKELSLSVLSSLSYLSFGQTGSINFMVTGKAILKTSPSGGARHPTEAYIINLSIKDLPIGVYHFSVQQNKLVQINKNNLLDNYQKVFYQLNHFPGFEPKAIIILTSIAERSMWRYRESRSSRVLFFDIGHIIKTTQVCAQALGIDTLVGDGFVEQELKKILELSGINEQPFNFIALQ